MLSEHMSRTHKSRRHVASRSYHVRLAALEAELLPAPEPEDNPMLRLLDLMRWAYQAGGHAAELAGQYGGFADELLVVCCETRDAGEIAGSPGSHSNPWRVYFSPEHQARWDAANSGIDRIYRELDALHTQAQAQRRAEQERPQ